MVIDKSWFYKLTDILYLEDSYLLQHKIIYLIYGSVSLKDERKQECYDEIKDESFEESED
jgi:hypothetical protein